MSLLGVVIIGRNEGERLKRCILSLLDCVSEIVYVDSGSIDGSQAFAESHKIPVVDLDTSRPFTAGRARNTGFEYLLKTFPTLKYVQFIDGDCELNPGWFNTAIATIEKNKLLGIVCGRRRERCIDISVYNRMCDMEWDTPIGLANSCGGDFIVRTDVFRELGGFNPAVIAGEEPELCYRLRKHGFVIERLDFEMTVHDAAITKISQWWKRTLRSGHAFANNMALHVGDAERFNQRKTLSIIIWGLVLPVVQLTLISTSNWEIALVLSLLYVSLFFKIFWHSYKKRYSPARDALIYALFTVIGKFPQAMGVVKYFLNSAFSRGHTVIDYKS